MTLNAAAFLAGEIRKLKIAVIGDVMLDRYFYGEVKRISPEAPVPVTKIDKINSVLGGAANVAANLACLECRVFMGGVTGNDENDALLEKMLDKAGIDHSGLVRSEGRKTITKMRVLGGSQQMLRLDFEEAGDLTEKEASALGRWLDRLLKKGLDGIIVSDYAKGVCSDNFCREVIKKAVDFKIPVLIDPKGSDWSKYSGCTFITPNLKEMCEAAGYRCGNVDGEIVKMARAARKKYAIKNVVVTRSEKGMTLVNGKEVLHSPAAAMEVFDVSGAGDTVAAVLLAAAAGGVGLADAVFLANRAAGIVVSKVGTYPVHRDELLADILQKERRQGRYRTLSREEVASLAATWKACGEKVVFTNGCFDILHVGHVSYLEKAAELGKHLIVGLNTDASVRRIKGSGRPLNKELDRARVLSALACVDAVVLFNEDTPLNLIKKIRPDILVKGGDYKENEVIGREYAGEVKIIGFEEGYSTTGLVKKIARAAREGKI